ncbi:MAG: hypothetical protein IPN90_11670 [Elusimicrobia bacterium]|nr:hypothetical protein [Elusimicrobiota bacterium]
MSRARTNRGGAWAGLFVGVFLGLLLAAGVCAVFLWFVNGAVSSGLEGYLKKYVFDRPEASFGTVRVDVLHGRIVMTDLKLAGERLSLTVPEIEADVPPKELFSGNGFVRSLQLKNPFLEGAFSLRGGYGEAAAFRFPLWIRRLPIAQIVVTDGQLRLTNRDSDVSWGLRKIEGQWLHPLLEGGGGNDRFKLEGQNEAEAPGQFSLDLTLEKFDLPLSLNGEWVFRKWPIKDLARFISIPSDVQVLSGRLDLKTQLICKNDWLTASHLVDISDFKVEVSPRRKQLLGRPVKEFKDMMDIPSLSFVVPMNGSIHDPHVGIASSVQQILYKMLEGKIDDKKDLEKMCQRGGAYLGAKIDAALRARFRKKT